VSVRHGKRMREASSGIRGHGGDRFRLDLITLSVAHSGVAATVSSSQNPAINPAGHANW
jgi:hypothetical protein